MYGHCERFGCEANARGRRRLHLPGAVARSRSRLRIRLCKGLVYDKGEKVSGALCRHPQRREFEQPAGIVILGAYVFNNTLLMLTAGISGPTTQDRQGRDRQELLLPGVGQRRTVFFEDKIINPFMATGSHSTYISNFNGDNFDHGGLGFFGSAGSGQHIERPSDPDAPGPARHPALGPRLKRATAKWYNHASTSAHRAQLRRENFPASTRPRTCSGTLVA
jgi:gluconate 2-dehydrogenase alpha chain